MEQQESSQPPPPPRSTPVGRAIAAATAGAHRIAKNPRVRGEITWVLAQKTAEFVLQLATLKILTNLLGAEIYGELGLIQTALLLLGNLLIMPVQQSYLRLFHQADKAGQARHAGIFAFKWITVIIVVVLLVAVVTGTKLADVFSFGKWSVLAAGCMFFGDRLRRLAAFVANVRRERRSATIQVTGALFLQLALAVLFIILIGPAAASVLLAYAVSYLIFAAVFVPPLMKWIRRQPADNRSDMLQVVVQFGMPFGLLLTCQWIQAFTDRFAIALRMSTEEAGVYLAAFQVCGVVFMLMWFFLDSLLIPIAYQRARDIEDHAQLWSAYRVLLAGVVLYVVVGILVLFGYYFLGNRLLVALTSESFALGTWTVLGLAIVRFLQCLALLIDRIFTVSRSLRTTLALRIVIAIATPPVCWYAVGQAGIQGAVIGSLALALVHVVLQWIAPGGCAWLLVASWRCRHNRYDGTLSHEVSDPMSSGH